MQLAFLGSLPLPYIGSGHVFTRFVLFVYLHLVWSVNSIDEKKLWVNFHDAWGKDRYISNHRRIDLILLGYGYGQVLRLELALCESVAEVCTLLSAI